jgi:hypothetical protein
MTEWEEPMMYDWAVIEKLRTDYRRENVRMIG